MNSNQLAKKLAMEAAIKYHHHNQTSRRNETVLSGTILSTIPLVELLECVKELRLEQNQGYVSLALRNLDAKLGGKV